MNSQCSGPHERLKYVLQSICSASAVQLDFIGGQHTLGLLVHTMNQAALLV